LDDELSVPDFKFWSNTRPSLFDYPPKVEESAEKAPEKIATAVLSTTVKARQRAKRSEKEKAAKEAAAKGEDAMETDHTVSTPVTPGPIAEGDDKMDLEDDSAERKEGDGEGEKREEGEKKKRAEKEKVGYELGNMSRVLPEQLKYISFIGDGRYEPVKKPTGGILLLLDRTPCEPVRLMELKARKATVPTATSPGHTVGSVNDGPGTGGAAAAVNVLNAEDDEGDEDAPLPEDFEYITDGETEEEL